MIFFHWWEGSWKINWCVCVYLSLSLFFSVHACIHIAVYIWVCYNIRIHWVNSKLAIFRLSWNTKSPNGAEYHSVYSRSVMFHWIRNNVAMRCNAKHRKMFTRSTCVFQRCSNDSDVLINVLDYVHYLHSFSKFSMSLSNKEKILLIKIKNNMVSYPLHFIP